jgi:hypothetical protein
MVKTNKQINKEAEVNDPDSSLAVVAYRTSQLEQAVKDGFKEHNEKLDSLANNFATKADAHALDRRLAALESNQTWVVRLLIGQVFIALIATIGGAVVLNH